MCNDGYQVISGNTQVDIGGKGTGFTLSRTLETYPEQQASACQGTNFYKIPSGGGKNRACMLLVWFVFRKWKGWHHDQGVCL